MCDSKQLKRDVSKQVQRDEKSFETSRNRVGLFLTLCVYLCCCVSASPSVAVQAQKSDPLKSRQQVDLERAHFLVTQAFDEDEKGNDDEAVELYTQAVELCLNTVCLSLVVTSF